MDQPSVPNAENGLSSALDSIFSDPAARERFESLVQSFRENLSEGETGKSAGDGSANGTSQDGIAAILSNPAIMQNLPALLSGMRPSPSAPVREKSAEDRRRDLLLALKPFLSKSRGDAVDMILQISRLGNVLHLMR